MRARGRASAVVGLVAAAMVVFIPTADAEPGIVVLRNGGRVRGELVEIVPNEGIVVRVVDGTTMTFPWVEVQSVETAERRYDSRGNATPVPPVPSQATEPSPPGNAPSGTEAATAPGPEITSSPSDPLAPSVPPRRNVRGLKGIGTLFIVSGVGMTIVAAGLVSRGEHGDAFLVAKIVPFGVVGTTVGAGLVSLGRRRERLAQTVEPYGAGPLRRTIGFSLRLDLAREHAVPQFVLRF